MSDIGPQLPPHLMAKRKRQQEDQVEDAPSKSSGANYAPRPANPEEPEKRRKIIGPAMPPAPLDERPSEFPTATGEDSDSDSDDDFMPALPSAADAISATNEDNSEGVIPEITGKTPGEEKLKRDDWMMMPPKQDDLAARLDPSKQRPTKFNTGKGARGPAASDGDNSLWNETPEQRQKRLQDEIMGVSKAATATRVDPAKAVKSRRDEEAHRKIQQHTEQRGPSLLEQHRHIKGAEAEDDDPSKRAFDREKDMGSGGRISSTQKKEMLNKAAGFAGKFSGGTYL